MDTKRVVKLEKRKARSERLQNLYKDKLLIDDGNHVATESRIDELNLKIDSINKALARERKELSVIEEKDKLLIVSPLSENSTKKKVLVKSERSEKPVMITVPVPPLPPEKKNKIKKTPLPPIRETVKAKDTEKREEVLFQE